MKKFIILGLALALMGGAAYANYCARDYVPAATLLVPYATVDLDIAGTPDPTGNTTLLAVTNVSNEAQIIHVTVWSALSVPVVDFDEILTGYDVWPINFRDLLLGRFDRFDTGTSTLSPTGTSPVPWGPSSNMDTTPLPMPEGYTKVPSCVNPPYGDLSYLSATIISKIMHDIGPVYDHYCGTKYADPVPTWLEGLPTDEAFFYVTVDVVKECSTAFPNQSAYWGEGGVIATQNVIIGDIIYLNQTANFSESLPAVHIEADDDVTPNEEITFYDRYDPAGYFNINDSDVREPLATSFAFRYLIADGVTSAVSVWKDTEEVESGYEAYACEPFAYFAWDEKEKTKSRTGGGPSGFLTIEPNPFPYETQRVPVTTGNFNGLPGGNGWMLVVFDPSFIPGFNDQYGQAYLSVQYNLGGYSTALEAATIANANCFSNQDSPLGGVNFDYDAYYWE